MHWEKPSFDFVNLFSREKMSGYPCAFVNGNLFTGLFKQSTIFRLSSSDRAGESF